VVHVRGADAVTVDAAVIPMGHVLPTVHRETTGAVVPAAYAVAT